MHPLVLHTWHQAFQARFSELDGCEVVSDHADVSAEFNALSQSAGLIDLSLRSRLCLLGEDRVRFLHGQVTNDVKRLGPGTGCYAFLVSAKGKLESDLFVYRLENELLLDFEPGLTQAVSQRLEKFIVADDVEVVDVAPHYGLLSVQGPKAGVIARSILSGTTVPAEPLHFVKSQDAEMGEWYLVNQPRLGSAGFDIFAPVESLATMATKLRDAVVAQGGRLCGWTAFDVARVRAGVPRFGVDMDDTNLPQETGLEDRTISYNKGCYIGQEVINRIHTIGRVNKILTRFEFQDVAGSPSHGNRIVCEGRDAGYLTSVAQLPDGTRFGMGYLQQQFKAVNQPLCVKTPAGEIRIGRLTAK